MPKQSTTVTTTTTTQVKLKLSVKRQLLTKLKAYAELKVDLDRIDAEMKELNGGIEALRETTDAQTLDLEGFKVTRVTGTRHKLNLQKLVAAGCSIAWYNEANEEKPSKPFTKITVPGEKTHEREE